MASSVRSIPTKQFRFAQDLNAPIGPPYNKENGSPTWRLNNNQSHDSVARRPEAVGPTHDRRIECLAGSPLFRGLSAEQYRTVARAAEEISYSSDQVIFLQDEPVCRIMVVGSGAVRVSSVTKDGKETLFRLGWPGDWVGDTVASHQLQSTCARAKGATALLTWDLRIFEELSTRLSVIERNVAAITSRRLQALQERLCDLSTLRVPQRLARLVLQLAKEPENPSRSCALSRDDMTQMTGTSLFMVSRLLSSWAESEVVTLDRGVVVIEDIERLQQLAEAA
jgi:CRP-like cAMP-binding protein